MTWPYRQAQVLRALRAHRFMDAEQLRQVVFRKVSRRSCQRCLTLLHRRGLVVRAQPIRGGFGGGSDSYVYSLSPQGATVLVAIDDVDPAEIPQIRDPETFTPHRAQHQLAVNRCFIALWQALDTTAGHRLVGWQSDPHLQLRYRTGTRWRVLHPDGLAQVGSPVGDHWLFFEIDRGTNELRRYAAKARRYGRYWQSGAWRAELPHFPEVRIVTSRRSRRARLLDAMEDGVRDLTDLDSVAVSRALRIAVAWERDFLDDPLGPVWEPAFSEHAIRENLLRDPEIAQALDDDDWMSVEPARAPAAEYVDRDDVPGLS